MYLPNRAAFFLCLTLSAQNITYDWATKTYNCPAEVAWPRSATMTIVNANTLLYDYTITVNATPRVINDFGLLLPALPKPAPAQKGGNKCSDDLGQAGVAWTPVQTNISTNMFLSPQANSDGKYPSVPLVSSVAAFNRLLTDQAANIKEFEERIREVRNCKYSGDDEENARALLRAYEEFQELKRRAAPPWRVSTGISLEPEYDYDITVTETHKGAVTVGGEYKFQCKPVSNQLFLSGGFLMSTVANPSYSIERVPTFVNGVTQEETYRGLRVEHRNKLQPAAAALLNYRVPVKPLDRLLGLAVSAGPVYRLGSSADTSNLGFFGGISVHLWRRMFFTPGVHVGEFGDFPRGYSEWSAVPPGIDSINPVKRWTAKLAFGITFRTNAFTGNQQQTAGGTGSSTPTATGSTGSAAAPQPSAPKPAAAKTKETTNDNKTGDTPLPKDGEAGSPPDKK